MVNVRTERMKADLQRGIAQVFIQKGFFQVLLTDIYLSSDYAYAKVEIDVIKGDLQEFLDKLNTSPTHKEIIQELHKHVHIKNFPKIVFDKDSHKSRIKSTEEAFKKIIFAKIE